MINFFRKGHVEKRAPDSRRRQGKEEEANV
jgi:hypothetical protein